MSNLALKLVKDFINYYPQDVESVCTVNEKDIVLDELERLGFDIIEEENNTNDGYYMISMYKEDFGNIVVSYVFHSNKILLYQN